MKTIPARLLCASRLAVAAAALGLGCASAQVAGAAGQGGGAPAALRVAMDYVVPPFVGGAKVRTPETIDTALAEKLAEKLALPLQAVPVAPTVKQALLGGDGPRAVLTSLSDAGSVPDSMTAVPTGYASAPMAIMRTDTDIKSWEQLRGRTVCLSEGGRYVGAMAALYGAQEMVFRAPADALLALRIGECDAAVHDDVMLKALLKLPEWKKFSANLTDRDKTPLVFLANADDADMLDALRRLSKEWKSGRRLAELTKSRVNDIAFEVYLDQVVADCH